MTGLRAKEAQCFSSVIASPAFYGFSSSNRYEQDVSDDVVQVHPATEIALVPSLLLSSFEHGNGPVPSEYSVYRIPRFLRITPRLSRVRWTSFRCHSIFRVSCFLIDNWQIKKSDKLKIEKKSNMNISIIFRNLRNTYGEVEILYQRNNWYAIFTHRFVEFFFNFQSPSIFIEFDSMKRDRYRKNRKTSYIRWISTTDD